MSCEGNTKDYFPELIPRTGEWIAWLLLMMLGITCAALLFLKVRLGWILPILTSIMLLSAASISLGNWMDRHTRICINEQGIAFTNGLRKVFLKWLEIRELRIQPATWSKKVQVIGSNSYFDFHFLGEVKYAGEIKGRTGFVQGETILREIISKAGLEVINQEEEHIYYARK